MANSFGLFVCFYLFLYCELSSCSVSMHVFKFIFFLFVFFSEFFARARVGGRRRKQNEPNAVTEATPMGQSQARKKKNTEAESQEPSRKTAKRPKRFRRSWPFSLFLGLFSCGLENDENSLKIRKTRKQRHKASESFYYLFVF